MYYGKVAASKKAASKNNPFSWAQSQKPNQTDPKANQTIFMKQWHFTCVDKIGAVASPSSHHWLGGFM